MAGTNLTQNTSYGSGDSPSMAPGGFRYVPRTSYPNLARFPSAPTPAEDTPEYFQAKQAGISQYGNLLNNGAGVPFQQQFLPPSEDPHAPIPIPSDYGTFQSPMTIKTPDGQNLSWGAPTSPVIRNLPGDVPGQYVQDTADPNLLAKTVRGRNDIADAAIRSGRLGSMSVIDHIVPLSLGGADTLGNRMILSPGQNYQKTKAQAVPYTLYAYGDISLSEARVMAMQWKSRDLTDIPKPDKNGLVSSLEGEKTGIEIARETAKRWSQPKKPTIKDVIGSIPEAAKEFGKGFLPDPVRKFMTGLASGGTLGFVPHEFETDDTLGEKVAGITGIALGSLAPWGLATRALLLPMKLIRGMEATLGARKAFAVAKAEKLFGASGEAIGTSAQITGESLYAGAQATKAAERVATSFKTLNKTPGYVTKLLSNPDLMKQVGVFAGTSVVFGQAHQFVANKFNPYTISGQAMQTDQENMIGNILTDMSIGAVTGAATPTLKGTAYAVATPMALSFWINPDDPVGAITNGVLFGVMHGTATYKRPGYNNVEIFGGKPYDNPVNKAYNHMMDHASYESLRYYNPEILPEINVTRPVPKLPEVAIEKAKWTAIENVWRRFFFQKDVEPQQKKAVLKQLKDYSIGVDKKLDITKEVPKLPWSKTLSMSARRERGLAKKEQEASITKEFGVDYAAKNEVPEGMRKLPEEGMDLQTALTEIKRITVAARQLYKGTLSTEMRGKADLDDLLSFGKMVKENKSNLQNRFESQEKFLPNEIVGNEAIKILTEGVNPQTGRRDFMEMSSGNKVVTLSGKYQTGRFPLTGGATGKANEARIRYFMDEVDAGRASPNVLLVDRTVSAPLWRMKNRLLTPDDIAEGIHAIDPYPENALQAYGVLKTETGYKLFELGWAPSPHRLDTGKYAFNKHPGVLKYIATKGAEGIPPFDSSGTKDIWSPEMKKRGIKVLITNLDGLSTRATISTGNVFVVVNVNDANWMRSLQYKQDLAAHQAKTGTSPESTVAENLSDIRSNLGAREVVEKINEMKNNPTRVKPASEYIPKRVTPVNPQTDRITVPQESTRGLLQELEQALDVASPVQVKQVFQEKFGIILTEGQANDVFARRNDITMKQGVKLLSEAVNETDVNTATKEKLLFVKTYVESGALHASENGPGVLSMPILGRSKIATGVEDQPYPGPLGLKAPEVNATRIAEPTPVSNTQEPVTQSPVKSSEPGGGLIDRMVNAQRKLPKKGFSVIVGDKTYTFQPEEASYKRTDPVTGKFYKLNPDNTESLSTPPKRSAEGAGSFEGKVEPITEEVRALLADAPGVRGKKLEGVERATSVFRPSDKKIDIPTPKFFGNEFFKGLEEGSTSRVPSGQFLNRALDKGLKDMLARNYPNYKKDPQIEKDINDFMVTFFKRTNREGREIQQTPAIVAAKASGNKAELEAAYDARRYEELIAKGFTDGQIKNLIKKYGLIYKIPKGTVPKNVIQYAEGETGGNMSDAQLRKAGLSPEDWASLRARPEHQEGLVGDLTVGENLMLAVFSEGPPSGAKSVRGVRGLFMGERGLRQFLLTRYPKAGRSVAFDQLERDAVAADTTYALRNRMEAEKLAEVTKKSTEAENQLSILRKQNESITKALEHGPNKSLEQALEDIQANIKKFTAVMKETADGGGGPGYHDGRGGPGEVFGAIGGGMKNLWNSSKKGISNVSAGAGIAMDAIRGNPVTVTNTMKFGPSVFKGVDFSHYAADPIAHVAQLKSLVNEMPNVKGPKDMDLWLQKKAWKSPITGDMVYSAANKWKIDPQLLLAVVSNDTHAGGNPYMPGNINAGNVGTYSNKGVNYVRNYKDWQSSLDGAAMFLSQSRLQEGIVGDLPKPTNERNYTELIRMKNGTLAVRPRK